MENDMTEEEQKNYREAFDTVDAEGVGHISDLQTAMHLLKLNPTPTERDEIKEKAIAINAEGELTFDEFVSVVRQFGRTPEEEIEALREAFKAFDKSGDGTVNMNEMKQTLQQMGADLLSQNDLDDMFADIIVNDDGCIAYDKLVEKLQS